MPSCRTMFAIGENKRYDQPSIFEPANLLREARRQREAPNGAVPDICVLDPDGDLWRHLRDAGGPRNPFWSCYHTDMYDCNVDGTTIGVIGCAVGASYAVLLAEQLFVSGCRLLISVTSSGQLVPAGDPPYFVLIDRALRDEGTSYHYLSPILPYATRPAHLDALADSVARRAPFIVRGGVWTTDAPYRETAHAVEFAKSEGLLAVEMEAAALYAFAQFKKTNVICFAHVTNRMATVENDFEKGEGDGNTAMLALIRTVAREWSALK